MSSRSRQRAPPQLQVRESAKALTIRGEQVLIIKEHHADGSAFWTLPGGGIEENESRSAALHRELAEELRCQATLGDQVAQFWYAHTGRRNTVSLCLVYDCVLADTPRPNLSGGVLAKRWVTADELPPNTLPQVRHVIDAHSAGDTGDQ